MFDINMKTWRWMKYLCLFLFCLLLLGHSTEPAFTQEVAPLVTPRAQQVVGGEDAEAGEFPWQGWFIFRNISGSYSCGASLIHPRWVLTAAHCADKNAVITEVLLGAHHMSDAAEPGRQVVPVLDVHVHPDFNAWNNDNDIALLELAAPVVETEFVQPLSIADNTTDLALYAPGVLSIVTGWGALAEGGSVSETLQKVEVPIVDEATCSAAYGASVTENMLCAGFAQGGKDSCQGDSGGPLIVPDGADGWKQAGIVSWGVGCARPDAYGVYTKIPNYITWLKSTTSGEVPYERTPSPTPESTPVGTETVTATLTVPPIIETVPAETAPVETATISPFPTETPTPSATNTSLPPTLAPTLITPTSAAPTSAAPTSTAPTSTASRTPEPSATSMPSLTPTETSDAATELRNGNFNAGPGNAWMEQLNGLQSPGLLIRQGTEMPATGMVEGFGAWLGGENSVRSTLAQTVMVPNSSPIALIFDYEIQSSESCGFDLAKVQMIDAEGESTGDGDTVTTLDAFDLCATNNSAGWETALLDLSAFAGRTVSLQFVVEKRSQTQANFFLDNVAFTTQLVDGLASDPNSGGGLTLAAKPGVFNIALDWEAPRQSGASTYRVRHWNGSGAFVMLQEVTETYHIDSPQVDPLQVTGTSSLPTGERCYSIEAVSADGARLGESNRACALYGQMVLRMPDLVGRPGQRLAVPIIVDNAEGVQIAASDLWLDFDPRVLAIRDVAASPLSATQVGWTYSATDLAEDVRRLRINALPHDDVALAAAAAPGKATEFTQFVPRQSTQSELHGSGTLLWLFFDVLGQAGASSPLLLHPAGEAGSGSSIHVLDGANQAWNVSLVLQSATVDVVAEGEYRASLGDITGEGVINGEDISTLLQFATKRDGLTIPQRLASDVTGDQKITAADAALLYSRWITGEWTPSALASSQEERALVDTTVALRGTSSNADIITTTFQITNADAVAGADFLLAYEPNLVSEVVTVVLNSEMQHGTVSGYSPEPGFLNISLAAPEPVDGDTWLLRIVWRLHPSALSTDLSGQRIDFSLLDVHLSNAWGRDFVTDFANHTLHSESVSVSLSPSVPGSQPNLIFLPTIKRSNAP